MKSLLRFTQSLGLLLAIAAVFIQTSSALSQTTLVGFNCEVSSTDGNNLTKCGSQLNFNVSFPQLSNAVSEISLIFPNSFQIASVNGGVVNGPVSPVSNFSDLPTGALVAQSISVNGNSSILISLAYVNCNVHDNSPLNTSQLYFDCIGYSQQQNTSFFDPTFVNLSNLGEEFGAILANSNSFNPITISSGIDNAFQGTVNDTYGRTFSIEVNSLSIGTITTVFTLEIRLLFRRKTIIYVGTLPQPVAAYSLKIIKVVGLGAIIP